MKPDVTTIHHVHIYCPSPNQFDSPSYLFLISSRNRISLHLQLASFLQSHVNRFFCLF